MLYYARLFVVVGVCSSLRYEDALRSRGVARGGGGLAEEELELPQTIAEEPREEERRRSTSRPEEEDTLEGIWRRQLTAVDDAAPAASHEESLQRFYEELKHVQGGPKPSRSPLLSRAVAASLVGSARIGFAREKLSRTLAALPKVSRGIRLTSKERTPPKVHEALARALARALDAKSVVIDEAKLRAVRNEAAAEGKLLTRETLLNSLFAAANNLGTGVVLYVRDGGSPVLRSRGACRAVMSELSREESRVLLVMSSFNEDVQPASSDDEDLDDEEEEDAEVTLEDVTDDKPAPQSSKSKNASTAPVAATTTEPMFERMLTDLARGVSSHARKAAESPNIGEEESKYLQCVSEALDDSDVVKLVAERCARMLRDPSVKLHLKLSVIQQQEGDDFEEGASSRSSALRETLKEQQSSADPEQKVPASLMQWMGLDKSTAGNKAGAAPAGEKPRFFFSEEAKSLVKTCVEDLSVEPPADADARLDWERWVTEEARQGTWTANSLVLRRALSKASLGCEDWESLKSALSRDPSRRFTDADAADMVLTALKMELAQSNGSLAMQHEIGLLSRSSLLAAFKLGSASAAKDATALAQDKHERALAANVVQPDDVGVTYAAIGGLEEAKAALREAITFPLKYPELYSEGVAAEAVKGVLLFGPPGTGKTMLAKAVATQGGAAFLSIDASTIENKWLGESEKNAKAVFSLARRLAPCVIFIDEIDSLLSSRETSDDTTHGTLTSVKTTLMQEWDGLRTSSERVVVIGSTNRPFDLDEAVLRRMPRRILVDLPDADTREQILKVTLRANRLAADVNLTALSTKLGGYSGSDVYEICREAAVRVAHLEANRLEDARDGELASSEAQQLRPLKQNDFLLAIKKLSSSVAENGPEMSRVLEWNAQYGEVKKKQSPNRASSSLYL